MAEIEGSEMFTSASPAAVDLLEQACKQVFDDNDDKNQFITLIPNNDNNSEIVQLTPEEIANFGVLRVISDEGVMYELPKDQGFHTSTIQGGHDNNNINVQDPTLIPQNPIIINQISCQPKEMSHKPFIAEHMPQFCVPRHDSQEQIMQKFTKILPQNQLVAETPQVKLKLTKKGNLQHHQASNARFNDSNYGAKSFNKNMNTVFVSRDPISNNVKLSSTIGHLLKTSDISIPMCNIQNQPIVTHPNTITSTISGGTQIYLTPHIKQSQSQNRNSQQFVTLKGTSNIQTEATNGKNMVELIEGRKNSNIYLIQAVPNVKAQNMKKSSAFILKQKQISLLKNQQKVAFNNLNKQNATIRVQNVANTSRFQNVSPSTGGTTESVKLMQTENIIRALNCKRFKLKQGKNVSSNECINLTKRLGSIENPIWITQQDQGVIHPIDLQLQSSPNQSLNRILQSGKQSTSKKGKRGRPKRDISAVTSTNTQSSTNEVEQLLKEKTVTITRSGRKTRTPTLLGKYYELSPSHSVSTNSDNLNGRAKTMNHFETLPDNESPARLSASSSTPKLNTNSGQYTSKCKSRKRCAPLISEEAKSKKRQTKLQTAIDECKDFEIIKVVTKHILRMLSVFDLLVMKSDNDPKILIHEVEQLIEKLRKNAGLIFTTAEGDEVLSNDFIIIEDPVCNALGLNPGSYKINKEGLKRVRSPNPTCENEEEPPLKRPKLNDSDEVKENVEDRMSSGFSESSDLSASDFLNDRRDNTTTNSTCPELFTALTLVPKNSSPVNNGEANKCNNVSKLLISNPEIQNQISDNPGFQKVDIMSSKVLNYQKTDSHTESFMLENSIESSNFCNEMENKYEQPKTDDIQQSFIKLQETEQCFILENGAMETYPKLSGQNHQTIQNDMENTSQNFVKEFQQVQNTVPIISSNCDTNIFVDTEHMNEINPYNNSAHSNCEMHKNLSNVEAFVSEGIFKIIQNDEILGNNVISNDLNLPAELDFDVLTEFNVNTR